MATAVLGERVIARPAPTPTRARELVAHLGRHTRLAIETVGRTGRRLF